MKIILLCLCMMALGILAVCQPAFAPGVPAIQSYFKPLSPSDTLHVEVDLQPDDRVPDDTIPNALFFKTVPPELLASIDYLADSTQATVLGRHYFTVNDSITAFWVEIRQFWFQHHCLLLFNSRTNTFTDRITLAEWYGGEGGQTLVGSWLFDFDGDGIKDIVRREIQHSMAPVGEEWEEQLQETVTVLRWNKGTFTELPRQDTALLLRLYPIQTFW